MQFSVRMHKELQFSQEDFQQICPVILALCKHYQRKLLEQQEMYKIVIMQKRKLTEGKEQVQHARKNEQMEKLWKWSSVEITYIHELYFP